MSSVEKAEPGQGGKRVDLDSILVEEVGQFGRYQLFTIALAVFPVIFSAFSAGDYVFTTSRTRTRCLIPQCDGENPEYTPRWVLNAIPGAGADSFEQCARFVALNASGPKSEADACPAALFDRTQIAPCDRYVYENTDSAVYELDLACSEWYRSLIGSFYNVGMLLAMPVTGYISDRWGRRVALALTAFNTGWVGLARSFVNSYEWFVVLEVVQATFGVTELVGPKYRVMAGAMVGSMFALGLMILGSIAWAVPQWRMLTRILYAPQLLIVCYFWIIAESVRWLLSQGCFEEAEKVLKKVSKVNNKELSQKSMELLRATAEAQKHKEETKEPWMVVLVFRSKVILLWCLVLPIWWITNSLVYYGMSVNAVNLAGNKYMNYISVASMGILAKWIAFLLLDRVGRKPVLIGSYLLCAACQFIFAFLPDGMDALSLVIYLIGKFSCSMLISSVYVYTTELFPTKYRHSLFAFCCMVGKIGAIVAPLTPAFALEVWTPLPSVLFGSLALLSGMLVLTMPETVGTKLPDTMEEAEQLSSRKVNT